MNKKDVVSMLVMLMITSSCRAQSCKIQGDWIISDGRLARNYEMTNNYSVNRVSFSKDTIELASGFFYNILGLDDEYEHGMYPYIYYGNKEKYKTTKDSLYIYSKPYQSWNAFKINCLRPNTLLLVGKNDSVSLERNSLSKKDNSCSIRYIKAHVHDGDLSLFKNNYQVIYSNDNKLIFQQPESTSKSNATKYYELRAETFSEICAGFGFVDLRALKEIYTTDLTEVNTIRLEIGMEDGTTIKSEIQNLSCPDELRLALVPILYTHQQYIYSKLPSAR